MLSVVKMAFASRVSYFVCLVNITTLIPFYSDKLLVHVIECINYKSVLKLRQITGNKAFIGYSLMKSVSVFSSILEWVYSRYLPSGAIVGGADPDGTKLYICRAREAGRTQCGKARYVSGRLTCYVPQRWYEHKHMFFETLVNPAGSRDHYQWVSGYKWGKVPINAVQCSSGNYVGRYLTRRHGLQVGKIDWNSFWYGYKGYEHRRRGGYQVLTRTTRPARPTRPTRKIVSYKITNVKYDLDRASKNINRKPFNLGRTELKNSSPHETTSNYRFDFQTQRSCSWSHTMSVSLEVGITLTVKASIPLVVDISRALQVSARASYEYNTGGSVSETVSHTIDQKISLPGRSRAVITIAAHKVRVAVPYTATLETYYDKGRPEKSEISGTFKDVEMTKFVVETSKK